MGVAGVALLRQLLLRGRAVAEPHEQTAFLQQLASPNSLMWQARRWPVKKRMPLRSNSSPPSSTAMLSRVVASTNPVLASGRTVSHPAPTQYLTCPQVPPSCAS